MRIAKIGNANYAIDLANKQKLKLVGIGGIDLVDAKKKLVLAVIWQLCRKDTLKTIGDMNEEKLLEWANSRVP